MQTEYSYVKSNLIRVKHAAWAAIGKKTGVSLRTIKRIAYGEVRAPRSDNVGKLALHFKTQEKRGK